jgi:chromosome segregation ATPase
LKKIKQEGLIINNIKGIKEINCTIINGDEVTKNGIVFDGLTWSLLNKTKLDVKYVINIENEKEINKLKEEMGSKVNEVFIVKSEINKISDCIQIKETELRTLENEMNILRKQWVQIDRELIKTVRSNSIGLFYNNNFVDRKSDIKDKEIRWNLDNIKKARLKKLSAEGNFKNKRIAELKASIKELREQLENTDELLKEINVVFNSFNQI